MNNLEITTETKKIRMKMSYKHAVLSLITLIECVQGPCKKNQNEISYTNFFAIAENIMELQFLFDDKIKEHQKELFSNYKISGLKLL